METILQSEEKNLLITVKDLERLGFVVENTNEIESYSVSEFIDQTSRFDYEYDSDKDPVIEERLYLSSNAFIFINENAASNGLNQVIQEYEMDFENTENVSLYTDPDLYQVGDHTYSAYVLYEGQPVGNLIFVHKDKFVISFYIIGIYFDNADHLDIIIGPKLDALINYDN